MTEYTNHLNADIDRLERELARLQAIVDTLLTTADGVVVTNPYTRLWRWSTHRTPRLYETTLHSAGWSKKIAAECYSTLKAAEASTE